MLLLVSIFITLFSVSFGASFGASAGSPSPPRASVHLQAFNSITGHVSDDRRAPLNEFQVELLNDVDSVIQRTKTDSSGLFMFRRLTVGTFQVRVQTYGTSYISQTRRVEISRGRGFEEVDFFLSMRQSISKTATRGAIFVQEVPELARKQFERGVALLQKPDQRLEGLASLKRAIEIFPAYFEALELLGTDYVLHQDYEAAMPVLTKAVEVNRRAYPSLYALSIAQFNLKQLNEAVESMRRAVTLDQGSVNANLWLGMLLRQTQKPDEAETYLKRANQLGGSKVPDIHWQLALLFNQLKRYGEAADELEQFLKIQPDSKDRELIRKLIERFRKQSTRTAKQ